MWRATASVSRRIRYQKPPIFGVGDHLSRLCSTKDSGRQDNVRSSQTSTAPPPPPPTPERGGGLFWKLLGLTIVGAGGVVGYAWYDEGFRSAVEEQVPYSRQMFGYVFKQPLSTADSVKSVVTSPDELAEKSLMRKKEQIAIEEEKKPKKDEVEKSEVASQKSEDELKREEALAEEKKKSEKELEEASENAALESILKAILSEAESAVIIAIELQTAAASATRDHTNKLRKVMDLDGEDKEREWEAAMAAYATKSGTLSQAESATESARLQLEKLRSVINDGKANKMTKQNTKLRESEQKLNSLNYDLSSAILQHEKAQSEARVMEEYRELLKKGREHFKKEIHSLAPQLSENKDAKLSEDELNSLIAHAHRRIEQLERHLDEQHRLEQKRIEAAVERQRQEDERLAQKRLKQEREALEAAFELVKDQWELDQRVEFELELRQQLSRQAAAHSDHLKEVLRVNEKKLTEAFERVLDDSLQDEKLKFQKDITGWIAKLRGMESVLEARVEYEERLRKAQELWLACQMLQHVIKHGPDASDVPDAAADGRSRMRPLVDEFMAILEAGDNHPFVNAILEAVPDEAVRRGVWTERELAERFRRVHRLCRRVALVDESGGSLLRYAVSYLQSVLVLPTPTPAADDRIDPAALDTFSILDHARRHVERGDLETALRFMNQLTGEPRRVAADWIREARLLLETQRAADALLGLAASEGLGSLF